MKTIVIASLIVGVIGAAMIGEGQIDTVIVFVANFLLVFIPLTVIRFVLFRIARHWPTKTPDDERIRQAIAYTKGLQDATVTPQETVDRPES